jgi:hypothetical protein
MLQQMMPTLAGMPGAQGGESMQAPQLNLPLRKIDDRWKVVLPFSIQEEQADLINDLMLLVKDLLADVTDQVDQAETLDAAAFMQIMSQTGTRMTPAFIGWWARAKMMMEAAADEAAAAAEPEDEQAAKPETAEEEPNSADTPRTRRERTP